MHPLGVAGGALKWWAPKLWRPLSLIFRSCQQCRVTSLQELNLDFGVPSPQSATDLVSAFESWTELIL